jgi:hypothetical protein
LPHCLMPWRDSNLGRLFVRRMRCHCAQEPILRLLNLQLQRQRCSRLERFSKKNKIFLFSKRARLPVAL